MHISDYSSVLVNRLGVAVNILSTLCCNTVLVFILLKQITFKLLLKRKKYSVCVVECTLLNGTTLKPTLLGYTFNSVHINYIQQHKHNPFYLF
jgi:hypothetical protein